MSFQERAKLAMEQLSKQSPVALKEAREQANRLQKAGEERFKKEAPLIQNELLKLIKPPLSFFDKVHIYRWLFRNQITIEMLSKEVFDEFKETKQYENYIESSTVK
jgi:hypothetical protein